LNLLQLIPLFTTGFIVSRIVARTSLAKRLVLVFAAVARGRVSIMLLAVMASAAVLSLFIPNLLTVLVLLPALEKLREAVAESGEDVKPLTTPLVLALIYGANTGGMGSLVGSPAGGGFPSDLLAGVGDSAGSPALSNQETPTPAGRVAPPCPV